MMAKRAPSFLRETSVVIVSALVLSIIVRTFVFQAFYVPSASMENTLLVNDRIVVSKISTRITGIHRGDVVVFHDPSHWLGDNYTDPYGSKFGHFLQYVGIVPANSGKDLVKRVIGVGGDRIQCCDTEGRIQRNGVGIDEPYIKAGSVTNQVNFDVLVPDGYVFVMGDNRGNSEDSRFHLNLNHGMVPLKNVVGRVSVRVWPFKRIGGIEH
jgi:signal peptidase I